jgi:hypothetical protein
VEWSRTKYESKQDGRARAESNLFLRLVLPRPVPSSFPHESHSIWPPLKTDYLHCITSYLPQKPTEAMPFSEVNWIRDAASLRLDFSREVRAGGRDACARLISCVRSFPFDEHTRQSAVSIPLHCCFICIVYVKLLSFCATEQALHSAMFATAVAERATHLALVSSRHVSVFARTVWCCPSQQPPARVYASLRFVL